MFNDYFDENEMEVDENESGIYYESACCGNVRENDIYEAIAEYRRMNEWD